MANPRDKDEYVRLLELMSIISEDWGDTVKEINNYLWKGNDIKHLKNAQKELQDVISPMMELNGLMEIVKSKAD